MDEDCDGSLLVIDLDDEREEQDIEINIDDDNAKNNVPTEDKGGELKSDRMSEMTNASPNRNDSTSDDDIQVIDDDDYEHSVQKLVNVANAVKTMRMQRIQKPNEQKYTNYEINRGNRNRLSDVRNLNAEQNQVYMDSSRDRVACCVKENTSSMRSGHEPDICQARYLMNDAPHFADNINTQRKNEAYGLEAPYEYRHINMHKPESVNIEEYAANLNRYTHNYIHRREVNSNNHYYGDSRNDTARYIYGPEVLSADDYSRAINRGPYNHTYRPDVAIDKNYYTRYGAVYRGLNDPVYIPTALTDDGYNCAPVSGVLCNPIHRTGLTLNNDCHRDAYRHTHTHRPEEILMNDDCRYRHAIMNRFPSTHAYADGGLDDYWQIRRLAYRPELRSIDDYYRRAEINRIYSNGYIPSPNPYRSGLDHHYRPSFENISALEPVLTRFTYPEAEMYYMPKVSHMNSYKNYNHKKDEAVLNLSRKEQPTNEANRHERMNGSKLRTILSTENHMKYSEDSKTYLDKQRKIETYITSKDNMKSSEFVKTNDPKVYMNVCKSGVPGRENRSTVILNTNNMCPNVVTNMQDHDVLAAINIKHDRYDDKSHIGTKIVKLDESLINVKGDAMYKNNEIYKVNANNVGIDRGIDKAKQDSNITFLVVFFTRVKDLVYEIFPEFSKSLETEIERLGEVVNDDIVKTDIQFICPLYCSVSTYSLPRFDNITDDNKIEKHINRNKICDLCTSIQNCYMLYKKKYFNLFSTTTDGRHENNYERGRKRKIMAPLTGIRNRQQTVQAYNAAVCNDDKLEVNKTSHRYPVSVNSEGNFHKAQQHAGKVTDDVIQITSPRLNENVLLDSKSISNFNVHGNNVDNNTHNQYIDSKYIEKPFQKIAFIASNENKDIDSEITANSSLRETEANLIHYRNEMANSDIMSNVNNKSDAKPDAEFICHVCSCIFTCFTAFVSHMKKEHDMNSIDEELVQCPFCGIYSKEKDHNDHVKSAHPQIFTHKGEPSEIQLKVDNRRHKKRKFIFTCLVCNKNLKSREVKRHREKEHKGLNVAKMFTKKLSSLD